MGTINFKKFKFFILDLISLGSSQAISIDLILILLTLTFLPILNWEYSPFKSVYNTIIIPTIFNNNCPSEGIFANCGFYSIGQTRAMYYLLHFNLDEAFKMNKLVLVLFIVFIWLLILNIYKSYRFYKKTGKIFNY